MDRERLARPFAAITSRDTPLTFTAVEVPSATMWCNPFSAFGLPIGNRHGLRPYNHLPTETAAICWLPHTSPGQGARRQPRRCPSSANQSSAAISPPEIRSTMRDPRAEIHDAGPAAPRRHDPGAGTFKHEAVIPVVQQDPPDISGVGPEIPRKIRHRPVRRARQCHRRAAVPSDRYRRPCLQTS